MKYFIFVLIVIFSFSFCEKNSDSNNVVTKTTDEITTIVKTPILQGSKKDNITVYNRHDWGTWVIRDGYDTRDAVLKRSNVGKLVEDNTGHKTVIRSGKWVCPYTGETIIDPMKMDIDHLVPLGEVYASGGSTWNVAKRHQYYNTLDDKCHLLAVSSEANRSKGDKTPCEWKPPLKSEWCEYAKCWIEVKKKWDLSIKECEQKELDAMLKTCNK
jgi:hypothetical protein